MKIVVNDQVYDAEERPVMVILNDKDKANIAAMPEDKTRYAAFPEGTPDEMIEEFMRGNPGICTVAGEKGDIIHALRRDLPHMIRNTPHSCQTREHCCALHAAHNDAAEKVEEYLDRVLEKIDAGEL